jgi:dynein heavy chain
MQPPARSDVVQKLVDQKVTESSTFAWQSQMRYVWLPEEQDCQVRVADASFHYSYEYIGNTGRLVITPLTDRCYITLTQARTAGCSSRLVSRP